MGGQPPDVLVPGMPEVVRIGHKGAHSIEPGNTRASFEAALSHGVDMIEFDVLSEQEDGTGELRLAHDYGELRSRECLTLDEGLSLFASEAYAGVRLDLDLKWVGYEDRVVEALRRHGLVERTLISTMETRSLRAVRALEPAIRLGRSVPKLRSNPMDRWYTKPVGLYVYANANTVLLRSLVRELRAGEIDAVMAHWGIVSKRFAATVMAAGGELYVWTVDDAERIAALQQLAVTGVITNDPRLFRA